MRRAQTQSVICGAFAFQSQLWLRAAPRNRSSRENGNSTQSPSTPPRAGCDPPLAWGRGQGVFLGLAPSWLEPRLRDNAAEGERAAGQ